MKLGKLKQKPVPVGRQIPEKKNSCGKSLTITKTSQITRIITRTSNEISRPNGIIQLRKTSSELKQLLSQLCFACFQRL